MIFFYLSAFIAAIQIILLVLMVKSIENKKKAVTAVFALAKLIIYAVSIFVLVDVLFDKVVYCISGYLAGAAFTGAFIYICIFYLSPYLLLPLIERLLKNEKTAPYILKIIDLKNAALQRLGLGNQRGFKVKKLKTLR